MPGLEALPTLDALAADTSLARSLDPSSLRALYARAARLEAELRAYLLTTVRQHRDSAAEAPPDHALTLREAADILRVSRDTLYRKWRALPFAFKDALDGRVKFRRRGLERYVEGPPPKGRV